MKKLMMALACVCALGLFADEGPIYLKADATGTGDGSSWENAMMSVDDAITLADMTGRPVYAAGGYYKMSATHTLEAKLVFRGGFPGVSMSETPADCDSETYRTFVAPVAATAFKWNHATPNLGAFTISRTELDAAQYPVFTTDENGVVTFNPPPDYTDDYDSYYISGGNSSYCFANAGVDKSWDVSGVWFIGYTDYPLRSQVGKGYDYSDSPRVASDCRFYGSRGVWEKNNQGDSGIDELTVWVRNCDFRYTYNIKPLIQAYESGTLVENCSFSDHARIDVTDNGQLVWAWFRYLTVRGCTFRRATAVPTSDGETSTSYSAGNLISWNAATRVVIEDCTMEENLSMSKFGWGCSLFGAKASTVRNCRVARNRLEVIAKSGRRYALVQASLRATVNTSYDGCLFESNTVAEVGGEVDACTLGILGNGSEGIQKSAVVNCTFADNVVTAANPTEGIVRSQGVVYGASSAIPARMAVANCTFRHEDEEGLYDVVMTDTPGDDFPVVNCVFTRGLRVQYDPILASLPERLYLRACSIGGKIAEGNEPDAVPLERAVAANGSVVWRPACKMPSLRTAVDIVTNDCTACALDATRPPVYVNWKMRDDEGTGWIALLGESLKTTWEAGALGDAAGETRPLGSFTRGAVQTLSDAAEAGNTLLIRNEPWGAGTFTPDYWQVVAPNAAPAAVTAVAADPDLAEFSHWVTAGGEVGTNPLELGVLSEGVTTVTAVFAVPTKKMTFDLGEYGTFEDGSTRCEVEMMPGTPLVIPAFTVSDDWVLTGWSPAIPAKVPAEATTFTATAVTKLLRVIRLAPADDPVAAGGKGDGSSWADAYRGDFAAAYADAAAYRGEVWIKKGAYNVTSTIFFKPRVRVIGGFAGDETSADAADPAANPAILTGDVNHDNYWKVNASNTSAGVNVIDYENLAFNEPQPADRETYWAANGNNGDDTVTCFIGNEPLTECVLEGITLTCFKGTTIQTENSSPVKLVKCRFLANNTGLSLGAEHGAFVARGTVEAEDCDFYAMHTPLAILDGGVAYTDPIRLTRCRFRFNHGYGNGTGGGFSMETGNRDLIIDGCEFTDNFGFEYQGYQRCPVQIQVAKSITLRDTLVARNTYKNRCVAAFDIENVNGGIFISNCVFRGNQKIGHGNDSGQRAAALRIVRCPPWNDGTQSYIRDTLFESNSVVRQAECNTGTGHTLHQASALQTNYGLLAIVNCSFVDNSCEVREGTTVAAGSSAATVQIGRNNGNSHTFFLNCIFSGNVVAGEAASEVAMATSTAGNPIAFVNSVFDGSKTPNYEPFAYVNANPNLPFMAAHCRITGYTAEKYASQIGTYGFDIGNSAEMPTIAKAIATGANGISALPVRGTAKQGVPVYLAPDGFYYLHLPEYNEAKPYLRLKTSITAMPVATLPAGAVANADAFGVAPTNRKARPSLGPVNDKNGLLLMVK